MTTTAFDPYANALALPWARGRAWLGQARDLWLEHWPFFSAGALLVLLARWQLDFMDGGAVIVLSYFTDAILFGLVYFAIREHRARPESPALLFAWRIGKGRLKEVALCGLWGLPAAAASQLIFLAGPELIKAVVYFLGSNLLGLVAMLLTFLAAGYAAFLASLLPNLAAIQAVRAPDAGFRAAGLWAFRGMRSGWRPLAVIFMAFISACFAAGVLLTPLLGHLPADLTGPGSATFDHLLYWFPWPALFIATNLFVALLFPMADDLLRAADHDLSDEVFDGASRDRTSQEFVAHLLDQAGFVVASLAAFGFLFWALASVFTMAGGYAQAWLMAALFAYLWSRSLYKSAAAWRADGSRYQRFRFAGMLAFWAALGLAILAGGG